MRTRKIRGLKRRQKNIDLWFAAHKQIDYKLLNQHSYYYCKAKIDPWSNLFNSSKYPSNYRQQLFGRLLDIYELWHEQLKSKYNKFYLAVWLFDNRFIDSQVVAAIGERTEYYETMWYYHDNPLEFPTQLFHNESERTNLFSWKSTDDEDLLFESNFLNEKIEDYYSRPDFYEEQRYYRKLLKSNTPTRMIGGEQGNDPEKAFVIKQGNIWIGKRK